MVLLILRAPWVMERGESVPSGSEFEAETLVVFVRVAWCFLLTRGFSGVSEALDVSWIHFSVLEWPWLIL